MTNVQELLEQAYRKLDENDYEGSRDDYRRAAIMTPPERGTLSNLHVAEENECLEFRRKLRETHPNSLTAQLAEPDFLRSMHRYGLAVARYTQLLETWGDDPYNALNIRHGRFNAICASPRPVLTIAMSFWMIFKLCG